MPQRYVVIPMARTVEAMTIDPRVEVPDLVRENALRADYVAQKNAEWKLKAKKYITVCPGTSRTLRSAKDMAILYVQAHGYTNCSSKIGGDFGIGQLDPEALVTMLFTTLKLKPELTSLKIKIWACYSGFEFAEAFYNEATETYPAQLRGLIVDGYKGATRTMSPKMVKQTLVDEEAVPPWSAEAEDGDAVERHEQASSPLARVRFGPYVPD